MTLQTLLYPSIDGAGAGAGAGAGGDAAANGNEDSTSMTASSTASTSITPPGQTEDVLLTLPGVPRPYMLKVLSHTLSHTRRYKHKLAQTHTAEASCQISSECFVIFCRPPSTERSLKK